MDKIWAELYNKAKEALNPIKLNDYISCGEVAAAILSKKGNIYVGVCIDTCSALGICAERNAIFNMVSNKDYETLDLSSLEQYISFGRKVGNFFKGLFSDVATVGLGLVEGVMDFAETGADLVRLGGTLFASLYTGTHDLLTGDNLTERMWEETKAEVSEKKVESLFNSFYSDTALGKSIKDNFSLKLPIAGDVSFDTVRGISKGVGYSTAMLGFSAVTGGLASGLGIGAQGSVSVAQLTATAGALGFSNGTEEAWADGATTGKGLLYGVASGG